MLLQLKNKMTVSSVMRSLEVKTLEIDGVVSELENILHPPVPVTPPKTGGGALRRVRQWFGRRVLRRGSKKDKKRGKNFKKETNSQTDIKGIISTSTTIEDLQTTATPTSPTHSPSFTPNSEAQEKLCAEIRDIEAQLAALRGEQLTADREWSHLSRCLALEQAELEQMDRRSRHLEELDREVAGILRTKMELEEETRCLKSKFKIKVAQTIKPEMVTIGIQTDSPNQEEMYGRFQSYKEKVSELRGVILSQMAERIFLEQGAAVELENNDILLDQTNNDIDRLEEEISKLTSCQ